MIELINLNNFILMNSTNSQPKGKKYDRLPNSLQEKTRLEIIGGFFLQGLNLDELASLYNKRKDAVKRIIDTYKRRHTVRSKKGSGRKEKLTDSEKKT